MSPIPQSDYSEDTLVEQPSIELFAQLGWETANCFNEFESGTSTLGRENKGEVVLVQRLRKALERLNPELSAEAFDKAIEEITLDRSAMSMAAANREVYTLLKDGVKVEVQNPEGHGQSVETVRVIDWNDADNNDFFLASQFWMTGQMYTRRADLIGFVNGLPLVFIELKASHKRLETAYNNNLRDYKNAIPQLFWYNALIILSNGSKSKIGSVTANWEHFADWKRINDEGEVGVISLETMIRGACQRDRLLDIVENFMVFMDVQGGLIKLVSKNHQYLGVNNTIEALKGTEGNRGRLGVFWHTQGSGKSVSMIFFAQKVFRKLHGNWTFVVITDRKELDGQIYKNFVSTGVVTEQEAQASSSQNLRQLLREDHRYVFSLIHKFRTENGQEHPMVSDRSDIIVIADEAHRSQYDTLALNMRTALPNAAFIAFTGTPLIAGEEKTRDVFGDYVSTYDFKQSIEDKATVPLYYENRIPELQLVNEDLNEDMEKVLEAAELDPEQEKKLEREFTRQYHLVTRDDRLETVAKDIVSHFMGRGYRGKAMVVCIDKATAVKMYDKVQKYWQRYLEELEQELTKTSGHKREAIEERISYMRQTNMVVVVSQAQNEIQDMRAKGLNIEPHRQRMVDEDLDTKFKDPDDQFRVVFVCAMWMTGFDVPCCSTIYLDKLMRNHTLMQTIARANRVFGDKVNGLIVDYVGVFRNLQKALAIYGQGGGEGGTGGGGGGSPVEDKSELVKRLREAIAEVKDLCDKRGISLETIQTAEGFDRVKLLDDAVDAILVNDQNKKGYLSMAAVVGKLYKAILPDRAAGELLGDCVLISVIAKKIHSLMPPVDITEVTQQIEELLDESIATEGYEISETASECVVDLSKIDFEALKKKFAKSRKRIEVEKLKSQLKVILKRMVDMNRTRINYVEKFQKMIDEYNDGSTNVEEFFRQLMEFGQSLNEEEKRAISENLSEEELTIFDLLTKPDPVLSKKEQKQVKKVARDLLNKLKDEKLVLDWRKRQQARATVRQTIEQILDHYLPEVYASDIFQKKCELVYQHVYESYFGANRSIYAA